jgi:hypothetical protein
MPTTQRRTPVLEAAGMPCSSEKAVAETERRTHRGITPRMPGMEPGTPG